MRRKKLTVRSYMGRHRGRVILWLAVTAALGFFAPLKSFILQWIIDSTGAQQALRYLLLGVVITLVSHALEALSRVLYTRIACGAMDFIRSAMMKSILARPMEQAEREGDAGYLSLMTADMRALYDEYFTPLFNIAFWGAILLWAMGMYLYVSPILLVVVAVMSVPPLIVPKLLNSWLSREREAFSGEMARYTQRIKEILAGHETIRAFRREEQYEALHARSSRENARGEQRVQQGVNATIVSSSLLSNMTFIIILFFGMTQVFSGRITIGYMVTASQLANFIIGPCQTISQNYARLRATKGIRTRIEALMNALREQESGAEKIAPVRELVCEDVRFTYPGSETPVLRGVLFDLRGNEKAAFVGQSGCGKSTLAKLLYQYYPGYEGSIRVDGTELSAISRGALYGQVGYISQKTFLFNDTIRNNICLYERFTDEQMKEAVRVSGLEDYIGTLPEGLDTCISENGRNLSGGQSQRIGIARAAIRGYRVILADEITASLDERTTEQVMDHLLSLDAMVIAITHDTQGSFMKRFDKVYRMEEGQARLDA